MKFSAQKYKIEDIACKPFIDNEEIYHFLNRSKPDSKEIKDILEKSLSKQRLNLEETATLINADSPELIEQIKDGARKLKEEVYGNRIVLFAPLYVGTYCTNNCQYCGFRVSNPGIERTTLNHDLLVKEIEALEDTGQKRLILVFGEHPDYSPDFIAESVRIAYEVKKGQGEIRRVNINAAPQTVEGFKTIKQSGIGTYQIFQETYHRETYEKYHPTGQKKFFEKRLISLDHAQEAGIDDVGIGALFGLYDWRFEVMSLVRHTNHLEAVYNVGPHTISFPRLQEASSMIRDGKYLVTDDEFSRLISILRLAVPYTGLILTARENASLRKEVMKFGVSQIDGGTRIEPGEYSNTKKREQNINREQFRINDDRSLNEVIDELISEKFLPSFCTACYRSGRTGEHFMEFSVPGFIKRFCSPNAILTLAEYLRDYANENTAKAGWELIDQNIISLKSNIDTTELESRLERIKKGEKDLYF